MSGALDAHDGMSLTVTGTGGGGAQIAVFDAALQAPEVRRRSAAPATPARRWSSAATAAAPSRTSPTPSTTPARTAPRARSTPTSRTTASRSRPRTAPTSRRARPCASRPRSGRGRRPSQDQLDLYFAANADEPDLDVHRHAHARPPRARRRFSATYTLPARRTAGRARAVPLPGERRPPAPRAATTTATTSSSPSTSARLTTVFFDNFETELGWTTNPSGTDTATTGLWERGDPEPTDSAGPKQLGTTVSGVNDLVTGRLAGASAGVTRHRRRRHHDPVARRSPCPPRAR